ncbi:MAG TPA: methyltransferase domain-containing protein, partial [Candidatus Limnocylindrales bacterium]
MSEEQPFYATADLNTAIYDPRTALQLAQTVLGDDIAFYGELAREVGGHVLEVGCGTGRVAIELARDGYDVTGVDVS